MDSITGVTAYTPNDRVALTLSQANGGQLRYRKVDAGVFELEDISYRKAYEQKLHRYTLISMLSAHVGRWALPLGGFIVALGLILTGYGLVYAHPALLQSGVALALAGAFIVATTLNGLHTHVQSATEAARREWHTFALASGYLTVLRLSPAGAEVIRASGVQVTCWR